MGAVLDSMLVDGGATYTYDEGFCTFIESYLTVLRTRPDTRQVTLTAEQVYLFRHDLTSFLLEQGIPLENHFIVMRVNNFTTAADLTEDLLVMKVPDSGYISQLKTLYRTTL